MIGPVLGLRAGRRCLAAVGVVLAVAVAGCGSDDDGASGASTSAADANTIPVGVLHSLSSFMAISEVSVKDAELLAIEEINAAGGVLGKQLKPIVEDGQSDWPTFAEKAQKTDLRG